MTRIASSIICGGLLSGALLSTRPAAAQPPQVTIIEKKPIKAVAAAVPALPTITWKELSAQLGGPTLVTLSTAAMPGGEAIDALAAQLPFTLRLQGSERWKDTAKTVTVDYRAQPFWRVALDVAEQLDGDFRDNGERGVLFLPYRSQKRGLNYQSGPGVFALKRTTYVRSVEPGADDSEVNESLSLTGTLYTDPKLQWQNTGKFLQITDADDEQNQSLLLDETRRVTGSSIDDFTIRLKAPKTRGGKLKRLRGNFHGVVAVQSTNWEVNNVLQAKNVEKILKTGDTTTRLELQDVTKNAEGYLVTVVVSQSGDQIQSVAQLTNGQRVRLSDDLAGSRPRLLDDKGRELQVRSTNFQQNGDEDTRITTLSVTFVPNRRGEESQHTTAPTKFMMRYDAAWRELVVPFEFENVALP